jgi:hypothetical protein
VTGVTSVVDGACVVLGEVVSGAVVGATVVVVGGTVVVVVGGTVVVVLGGTVAVVLGGTVAAAAVVGTVVAGAVVPPVVLVVVVAAAVLAVPGDGNTWTLTVSVNSTPTPLETVSGNEYAPGAMSAAAETVIVVRQSSSLISVGVENEAFRPGGGPALNAGVSEVNTWMKVWLVSPARTSLALMTAAAGAAVIATTPSVAMSSLAPRSAFMAPM